VFTHTDGVGCTGVVPDDGVTVIHDALPASLTGNEVDWLEVTATALQGSVVPIVPENDNEVGDEKI